MSDSEYNTRRNECKKGIFIIQQKYPVVQSLRDVTIGMLNDCSSEMPNVIFRRCHHVVSENNRVLAATQAMKTKGFNTLGTLIYQSHDSLQNDYEVSCKELDYLVDFSKNKDYILGSRMMGGGFGGCTINVIEKKEVQTFINEVAESYKNKFGIDLSPYSVDIEDGAKLVE